MLVNSQLGMNKMIVNHLQKLFVTSDAATIIKELDVAHPAARIVVLASQMQEQEVIHLLFIINGPKFILANEINSLDLIVQLVW